jgi:RNA polymerase sigma factor for flagellar operon FliA
MAMEAEELALWAEYSAGGDLGVHNALFHRYAGWSRGVARDVYRRLPVPQAEWGDYVQNATLGLLEAMGRFDLARGVDFKGFAKRRVRGAVFNGLRAFLADHGMHDGADRARDRYESLTSGGGSGDALEQIIDQVAGLGLAFLLDAAAVESDAAANGAMGQDPSVFAEKRQMDLLLEQAIAGLPERERLIVDLHYQQHLPFVDIASMLGVTKGRVSQLHRVAVERMRARVRDPGGRRRV